MEKLTMTPAPGGGMREAGRHLKWGCRGVAARLRATTERLPACGLVQFASTSRNINREGRSQQQQQ